MTIRKYNIFTQKVNLLFHNVEKWPNIFVNSARFLKYDWPFLSIEK